MEEKKQKPSIKEKGGKIIKEFKAFISRGNVIDLAVGVIIGGAFGKIVTSLVNDVIMPLIGILLGGLNFANLSIKVKDATINYGAFIQNIIDFLIVAVCIFVLIKIINAMSRKKEQKDEAKPAAPVKDEKTLLLEEIRDLLKEKNSKKK